MSGSKTPGKSKSKTRDTKRVKVPITDKNADDKTQSIHVTYEDAETVTYAVPEPTEQELDAKFEESGPKLRRELWDEVEMKHHGLVDDHCHHDAKPPGEAVLKKIGHVPFDEIEMKHSGYVDDHCHHMTETDLVDDVEDRLHKDDKTPHVNIDSNVSVVSGATSTPTLSAGTRATINIEEPNESDEKSQHLILDTNVESIDVETDDAGGEVDQGFAKARPAHLPWDELQMKEHGLLDAGCHHKTLPEDDVQLHREGKIDDHGQRVVAAVHKIPMDEVKMKRSGYVDARGHHMTETALKTDGAAVTKTPVEAHVDWLTPATTTMSESSSTSATDKKDKKKKRRKTKKQRIDKDGQMKVKRKEKKSKAKSESGKRTFTLTVNGMITVTEAKPTEAVQ